MAYTSVIPVRRLDRAVKYVMNKEKTTAVSLQDALDYAANRDKTEQSCFESSYACTLETAFADMRQTREQWNKPGGVQGYHLVQSFAADEVTPELAHQIAKELADRVLGGRYEYVIGTHLNTDHIHSHIVWNSVSRIDGKKYHSNGKSYVTQIRAVSDELCRKYKLSVIDTENSNHVAKPYAEWLAEKNGQPTWRTAIRQDVDEAIQQSLTWRQFLNALERNGSAIGRGLYSSAAQSGNFMVQSAGQNWRCFLQGQAMSTTQWRNILVMQPVTVHSAEVLRLLAVYAAAFMLGWAALILMSAILARFAVRPIEQAQTEQIRFLASASHELKTPLAVISTSADLLKQKSQDLAEPCHLIQQQTRQMGRLIDDMLVLTNSNTGHWTLQLRPVLPEEAAMTAYETFQPVLARAEQMLALEMPDAPLPMVLADEQRLQQILAILLDNAHTYASPGSAVALRVDFQHNQVRFWVIDHGPGIPDNAKQAVFTYFYRQTSENECAATVENSAHHYGLGLTVATELANLQHGSLTVQDTPGGGASFCLVLPAKQHT